MISKKSNGKGFRGLAQYLLRRGRGDIIAGVMAGHTPRELAHEFGQLRCLNPRMKQAVMHFSISPAPEDPQLTDAQWQHIAQRFIEALGYQDAPWVAVMHRDDPLHVHMHIMTSRIDLKGRTVSNFNDYRKAEKLMRQLEDELGLRSVEGAHGPRHEPQPANTTNNHSQGGTMQSEDPTRSAPPPASDQPVYNPGTSIATLGMVLTHPEIRANGASAEVLPKVAREMRRRTLDPDYEGRMRALLGPSLTRAYRHSEGVLLYFREKGEIHDLGSRLIAQGGMEEQLAAQRIVAMGQERGWSNITFTGSPRFIEHAMRAALRARLEVIAKGDQQAEILAKVMAERRGGMGALALPVGAIPADQDIQAILAELDDRPAQPGPMPSQPAQPTAPVAPPPAPPDNPTAPKPPQTGVLPIFMNLRERLQDRRAQKTSQAPGTTPAPPVKRPGGPAP